MERSLVKIGMGLSECEPHCRHITLKHRSPPLSSITGKPRTHKPGREAAFSCCWL